MKWLGHDEVIGSYDMYPPNFMTNGVLVLLFCFSRKLHTMHLRYSMVAFVLGRAHNLLPESESSRLLPISIGCWSLNLHAERQCHYQDSCGGNHIGMELVGSIPFHECCCRTKKKSPCSLPSIPDVYFCWISYHRHWLGHWGILVSDAACQFQDLNHTSFVYISRSYMIWIHSRQFTCSCHCGFRRWFLALALVLILPYVWRISKYSWLVQHRGLSYLGLHEVCILWFIILYFCFTLLVKATWKMYLGDWNSKDSRTVCCCYGETNIHYFSGEQNALTLFESSELGCPACSSLELWLKNKIGGFTDNW